MAHPQIYFKVDGGLDKKVLEFERLLSSIIHIAGIGAQSANFFNSTCGAYSPVLVL